MRDALFLPQGWEKRGGWEYMGKTGTIFIPAGVILLVTDWSLVKELQMVQAPHWSMPSHPGRQP